MTDMPGDHPAPFTGAAPAIREAVFVTGYACVVIGYLFVYPEGELLHWITLVLLPCVIVARLGAYVSFNQMLRSLGLKPNLRGPGWINTAIVIVLLQPLQLLNRAQRAELWQLTDRPYGLFLPLLAAVLLLGTAAATEEIFFRGLVQARLARALRSEVAAAAVSVVLFGLYHVPYAYARHGSPTHGDLAASFTSGFLANGLPGGVLLSLLYWRSRHNLTQVIFAHAAIDFLPATRWLAGVFSP